MSISSNFLFMLLLVAVCICVKAKLVQDTYVSSVIESLPQLNGVIDVSLIFVDIVH